MAIAITVLIRAFLIGLFMAPFAWGAYVCVRRWGWMKGCGAATVLWLAIGMVYTILMRVITG